MQGCIKLPVQIQHIIKKVVVPFVGPALRVAHFKVAGHQIFINKYTRQLPIYSSFLKLIDSRVGAARVREERRRDYEKWFKQHYPSAKVLKEQSLESKKFKQHPLISILTPTYNTNLEHLKDCIESVIGQSYDNWELCIADDKSTDPRIRELIKQYAENDKRVKYMFRETNGHICEATNSALDIAKGDFIALLDHDDWLWPNALFEVSKAISEHPKAEFIYSDEDKIEEAGEKHIEPFFKPDWSPEFLRSINYITHFAVLNTSLVRKLGGFRKGYEGAQDWDLFLRASRQAHQVYHIPKVIYSWRKSANSTAQAPSSKDYAYVNQKKALKDDIKSRGLDAKLSWQIPFSMWRVDYKLKGTPLVSIIIPTKNQYDFMKRCLDSIYSKTAYHNLEIVIADTGSDDPRVWDLYKSYDPIIPIKVVKWANKFNFAAVCDFGAEKSSGDYLLFLNNDTEIISPSWVEDMLGFAQQENIGSVGAKLYYPDRKIQHAGIILGVGGQNGTPGIAGHFFPAFIDDPPQDPSQQLYIGGARDFAAVTAACVMVSRHNFNLVKGFDPVFQIAFNDVDFCLKLLDKGLRNVYLPQVELFHHESVSVGQPGSEQRDLSVFAKEIQLMLKKWGPIIKDDPYYHPEFRRDIASARLNVK
jgi:glycosyltransferase involved in cell wall biosynthesis